MLVNKEQLSTAIVYKSVVFTNARVSLNEEYLSTTIAYKSVVIPTPGCH